VTRPKKRRDSGQNELFQVSARSDRRSGPPAGEPGADDRLAVFEERFGAVYSDEPGQPPLADEADGGLVDP
jgi:transposase, IS5 family